MMKNMGNADRIIRVMVAALMTGLYFGGVVNGTLGIILMVASGIFLLTSIVSFCPIYALVGLNTCKVKK